MTEEAVELAEFVLVEYRRLVGNDRTRIVQTVANRSRVAGVVPGDQEVVEVDADADDGSEGDPTKARQQVQPGVEPGDQADGDREQEVVSRVDRKSLGRRFAEATLMSFNSTTDRDRPWLGGSRRVCPAGPTVIARSV